MLLEPHDKLHGQQFGCACGSWSLKPMMARFAHEPQLACENDGKWALAGNLVSMS